MRLLTTPSDLMSELSVFRADDVQSGYQASVDGLQLSLLGTMRNAMDSLAAPVEPNRLFS